MQNINDLRYLARLMDSKFKLAGFKFGWDGLIGLIPGIGDFVTNSISLYIIIRAAFIGCGPSIILKMCFNVLLESVVDIIPVFGNLFDFIWKANLRNVQLIEQYLASPKKAIWQSRALAIALVMILATVLGLIVFTAIYLLIWSWQTIQGLIAS